MVISILDGSPVIEAGLEERVREYLCGLIEDETRITFYFYTDSPFVILCEWVVRELQAVFSEKQIESVAVLRDTHRICAVLGFSSCFLPERTRGCLRETLRYLMQYGGVSEFVVSGRVYDKGTECMSVLREISRNGPKQAAIRVMRADGIPGQDYARRTCKVVFDLTSPDEYGRDTQ